MNFLGVWTCPGHGCLLWYLRAPYASVFSFLMTAGYVAGAVHVICTKKSWLARASLIWTTLFGGVATYWSFGGNIRSMGLANYMFAVPSVALITSHNPSCAMASLALSALVLLVCTTLEVALGPGTFTPQAFDIPIGWQSVFWAMNICFPNCLAFCCCYYLVRQLWKREQALQASLDAARALAQRMVVFDVDDIPDKPEDPDGGVVDLMHHLALNLRRYRPYLPDHLFATQDGSEPPSPTHESVPEDCRSLAAFTTSSATLSRVSRRMSYGSHNSMLRLRQRGITFDQTAAVRCGTLFHVRMAHALDEGGTVSAVQMEAFHHDTELFAHTFLEVVHEHSGILQTLSHDYCTASWNLLSTCYASPDRRLASPR